MARTLMARLLYLTGTRSWVPVIPLYETSVVKFLHLCFHVLFIFYFFSDRRSLKIENENNSKKNLAAEAPYIGLSP